jgi:hypothetical protein
MAYNQFFTSEMDSFRSVLCKIFGQYLSKYFTVDTVPMIYILGKKKDSGFGIKVDLSGFR